MTDRMRKALEMIASGEGPQGGFLTRVQMVGIAREAISVWNNPGADVFIEVDESMKRTNSWTNPVTRGSTTAEHMNEIWQETKRKMQDAPPMFMTTDAALAEMLSEKMVEFRAGAGKEIPDSMGSQSGEHVTKGMGSQFNPGLDELLPVGACIVQTEAGSFVVDKTGAAQMPAYDAALKDQEDGYAPLIVRDLLK